MVRLKSAIYVQALIRRCEVAGAAAYLVRRGAEEAGAVFIKINRLDGTCTVLSPPRRRGTHLDTARRGNCRRRSRCRHFAKQICIDSDV